MCFLVFPAARAGQRNPLAGETTHHLRAGPAGGPPGRLLLIASPTPLVEFEAAVERSRVPGLDVDGAGIRLADEAVAALRRLEPGGTGQGPARPIFEAAAPMASHSELIQGLWVRLAPDR